MSHSYTGKPDSRTDEEKEDAARKQKCDHKPGAVRDVQGDPRKFCLDCYNWL